MRTVSPTLLAAVANGGGDIFRVNTWTDKTAYDAAPTAPDNVWECLGYDIFSTYAKAVMVSANDYTLSNFTVFTIERGATILGAEYTVESGLYFVRKYREDYGRINIEGSSYPNARVQINPADGTYQEVIEAFCAAIGKTAVFKDAYEWRNYQFLADGKPLTLNKAELFENLLKQKYTILVYETSPNNLVFYTSAIGVDSDAQWVCVCWAPGLALFVAFVSGGIVRTSPDGVHWTIRANFNDGDVNEWQAVCWSPKKNLLVAVSTEGGIATSPDAKTWTSRYLLGSWRAVCWSQELSLFVAVGSTSSNNIVTSPDGITWTTRTSAANNYWMSVCWSPALSLLVAVSATGTGNRVMTSPDGITWTSQTSAADNEWRSVCWSPALSLLVAVSATGTGNRVMTSPDGITWTRSQTNAADKQWNFICWSPELSLFVAVAYVGTGNRVMTSADGAIWTNHSGETDAAFGYEDCASAYITRDQSEVHFAWTDETGAQSNDGDTQFPLWNLGYLESTASRPAIKKDPYYKYFLEKAPVRLDLTDSDKINFVPNWSIDPTKPIDAMAYISEHFNPSKSPAWWQEIKSIVLFNKAAGA